MSDLAKVLQSELRKAGSSVRALVVASATDEFMLDGKGQSRRRPAGIDNSRIRILSGRLATSLNGGKFGNRSESRTKVSVRRGGLQLRVVVGSKVPYAAIHEFGGTIQRRMTHAFGKELKEPRTVVTKIPKRPYLFPAVKETAQEVNAILAQAQQRILDHIANEQS